MVLHLNMRGLPEAGEGGLISMSEGGRWLLYGLAKAWDGEG